MGYESFKIKAEFEVGVAAPRLLHRNKSCHVSLDANEY